MAGATPFAGSFVLGCAVRFIAIIGRDTTPALASQAFTAMIPLMIIVAGLSSDSSLGQTLVVRFHVSGDAAQSVTAAVVSAEWAHRSFTRSGRGNPADGVPG